MSWATRFRVRQYVRGSLWILPLTGGVLGVLLAEAAVLSEDVVDLPARWSYSGDTASSILTAIVGAMIALLGFVVTIGVLVIQTATGTLSPRFMRLWYRDRMQKVVLATFVTTLTMSFTMLRQTDRETVPDLGVWFAGVLVTVSLVLLVLYFDRFTHQLRPVAIAALVSRTGREILASPEMTAMEAPSSGAPAAPPDGGARAAALARLDTAPTWVVRATRSGSVQAIDRRGLVRAAERTDSLLLLPYPVGDYVLAGTVLVEGYGGTEPQPAALRGLVALGHERTIDQDPGFALRILVDVAIRALSPAVNDPTSAVQVLDHVEDMLGTIGATPHPGRLALVDGQGRLRALVPAHTWEEYLQLGVAEIREYGVRSIQVCRRLRAVLEDLCTTVLDEHRPAVEESLARLDAAVVAAYPRPAEQALARTRDRQGIGGPAWPQQR